MAQTRAGTVIGTLAYMSPEQARGKPVDFRSDIFSLGVTLYEMVTGTLPFTGDSALDTMHAIAFEETRPVTTLRSNIPPDLHRIISRCLRKRPEDRYPSTRDLVEDLKKLRRDIDSGFARPAPWVENVRSRLLVLRDGPEARADRDCSGCRIVADRRTRVAVPRRSQLLACIALSFSRRCGFIATSRTGRRG